MAFIIRAGERAETAQEGIGHDRVLVPSDTSDGRVVIDRWHMEAGHTRDIEVEAGAFAWLQVLEGEITLDGASLTPDFMTRLAAPATATIKARGRADVLVSRVPDARRFGEVQANGPIAAKSFDWTREPVLQSMHDDRKRIYVATKTLFETSALKGEMIIYPPGTTCPRHHHEGAEHYIFALSGSGVADVDGVEETVRAGDLFYILENEVHWFRNEGDEDFVFVEYFVPGTAKTIWAPGEDICKWAPTGADIRGREPSRHIGQHSHGDQTVV